MIKYIFVFFLYLPLQGHGQKLSPVSIIDFVKVKNDKWPEAIFYYENNWKVYRDIAVKENTISSYRLIIVSPDTTVDYDLILITEYADSIQYKLGEERFNKIIKATRPKGPLLLNSLKADEFRRSVFLRRGKALFFSE